jgi:hypothetical protein
MARRGLAAQQDRQNSIIKRQGEGAHQQELARFSNRQQANRRPATAGRQTALDSGRE